MIRTMRPTARRDKTPGIAPGRRMVPADLVIGRNIRALRLRRGVTQVALAAQLGVSFQQVQKYENGMNRVGAGRLAQIAAALDMPVTALFLGVAEAWSGNKAPPPITDAMALRAAAAVARIGDVALRRALLTLIECAAALPRAGPRALG